MNGKKLTTFNSIILILIKELRLERKIHQAQVANIFGQTQSSWTKIESGKSPLTFKVLLKFCHSICVSPTAVISSMELYVNVLMQRGWVITSEVEEHEDLLLEKAKEYYSQNNQQNNFEYVYTPFNSILNGPQYFPDGNVLFTPVFEYILTNTEQD